MIKLVNKRKQTIIFNIRYKRTKSAIVRYNELVILFCHNEYGGERMNKIKILRIEMGMTVRELSDKANVAVGYISTLENDNEGYTNPTKDVMQRIATALHTTVIEVFFRR